MICVWQEPKKLQGTPPSVWVEVPPPKPPLMPAENPVNCAGAGPAVNRVQITPASANKANLAKFPDRIDCLHAPNSIDNTTT